MLAVLRMLVMAVSAGAVAGISIAVAQAPQIPEAVKQSVRARVDHNYNVGIVVAAVNPDGRAVFSYGSTGVGGQEPDEMTVFEIGSITKVFTTTLLALMAERGEVGLDDPIEHYLPDSVQAPTRNGRSITLADLAAQVSALPRMPDNFAPSDPDNPYADYSVEQLYEFLSRHELRRDIGSQYEYSNYGMGLLGHLLSLRGSASYDDLVRTRIAEPLDMPDTRIALTPSMRSRLAPGHVGTLRTSNWDIPTLAGAGALRSTARDMLTFLAANLGLHQNDLHRAMQTTHEQRHEAGSPTMHIGYGWHIRSSGEREVVWHNGGTGGYRSFAGFVRDTRTGVVVLTNSSTGADDIGFHLLDATIPFDTVRIPARVRRSILERYVGSYELRPGLVFDIGLEGDQLTAQVTGQPRFPLYAESDTEFFLTVVEAAISFTTEEGGHVTGLVLHQGGVDQPARRLGPEERPSPGRVEVEVSSEVLEAYVGTYELAPGVVFDVALTNGRLMVMLTGQPRIEVYPESDSKFFYKVVDAQLTFVRDSSGAVTSLILHQGGMDRTAQRVP